MEKVIDRILIVDDEKEFVNSITRHLKREGFAPDTADNGAAACRKITDQTRRGVAYDLVITDLVMPLMGGLELYNWIIDTVPETSVILLTGFGNIEQISPRLRPELDGLAQKPTTPRLMMELIGRVQDKRLRKQTSV